jgi:hypothetical protein
VTIGGQTQLWQLAVSPSAAQLFPWGQVTGAKSLLPSALQAETPLLSHLEVPGAQKLAAQAPFVQL